MFRFLEKESEINFTDYLNSFFIIYLEIKLVENLFSF